MPTIVEQSQAVDLLRSEFQALADLCSDLSEDQWDEPTCLPGWTVRDVMSHIIGAEAMLLGEPAPVADTSHLGHMQNPVAEANEVWVESMRDLTGDQVRARFAEVTGRRLAVLDAMTQADFDAPSWTPAGRDETYGRFMRIRHYDSFMHEHDIRDALGEPSREEAADLASAVDEVATGLGYIVGRRAGMPDGSRVRFDLTGPVARTYRVAVDGRAALVESFDGEPTVRLELPLTRFLRLTGGRRDRAPAPPGEVTISGDRTLGEQLVANLAFTI
jgi:uncharacterized protein (TIGR03083 family)